MTNEQKQKVLQLLELCIDNNKAGEYACTFDAYPSNYGSVSVRVYIGTQRNRFDETYMCYLDATYAGENAKLDAAIEAIRTLPERAPALLAAKEAKRIALIEREYHELFGGEPTE
jgi:hypothetical protein